MSPGNTEKAKIQLPPPFHIRENLAFYKKKQKLSTLSNDMFPRSTTEHTDKKKCNQRPSGRYFPCCPFIRKLIAFNGGHREGGAATMSGSRVNKGQ